MNPNIISAFSSILAMDRIHGISLIQMMGSELKGLNKEVSYNKEWDRYVSRVKAPNAGGNIQLISEFGEMSSPDDATPGTIAIIPFVYPITKYDWWWAGTETKAALLQKCFNNPNIVAVILLMNTPGGEASAPGKFTSVLKGKNKPVYAVVDGLCASAGYWIAAAADKVFTLSEMDQIGSVGTFVTWVDFVKYYEDLGINVKDIYAQLSDKKNEEYREALKGNYAPLQKRIDFINDIFIASVMESRGELFDDKENVMHGQLYFSADAKKHGLTDGQSSYEVIISEVEGIIESNTPSTKKTLIF